MCTCNTFCWIRQLFNTTLIGAVAFKRTGDMCTCNTFCWTRQLFKTTLIGAVAYGGRKICVLVLHFAGSDSYLTLH